MKIRKSSFHVAIMVILTILCCYLYVRTSELYLANVELKKRLELWQDVAELTLRQKAIDQAESGEWVFMYANDTHIVKWYGKSVNGTVVWYRFEVKTWRDFLKQMVEDK